MEEKYYVGFSLFPGIGPVLFEKLVKAFGSAKDAWQADEKAMRKILKEKLTAQFLAFRKTIDLAQEYKKIVQKHITVITFGDKRYPALLKQIPHPPYVLYVKGNIDLLSYTRTIGIVGTRKITEYGRRVTEMFVEELVANKFCIISGLAFGVDAVSHMAAVTGKGKTIAVLGCGVDCCTPTNNQYVYDAILKSNGAIVSTFRPGESAMPGSFPARNAIIAGLSLGVVVTEGALDSGALITAHDAKKFNRPVFAVPGPITSGLSKGPNSLLQTGAIPVVDARDIMENLKIDDRGLKIEKKNPSSTVYLQLSREEQDILKLLEISPLHFDEIVRRIKKDSKTVGSLLSLMELKGMIQNSTNGYYSINY